MCCAIAWKEEGADSAVYTYRYFLQDWYVDPSPLQIPELMRFQAESHISRMYEFFTIDKAECTRYGAMS